MRPGQGEYDPSSWTVRQRAALLAKAPFGQWRTLTFLAALRLDRIDASCVIDGPINGTTFLAYVEQVLVPTLKQDDVVMMTPRSR
jgi:hypothetical protein